MTEPFASGSGFGIGAPAFPNFSVNATFGPTTADTLHDAQSPEMFKENLRVISEQVIHLQTVARSALDGIQNAYHPGSNPVQTESDIATLKQNMEMLSELMRQTGIGALSLLSLESPPPTEENIMADVSQSVKVLYSRLQRNQESAGVVANLLEAVAPSRRGMQNQK